MIKTVFMEDNIFIKDMACTAGSKALTGFAAPFDATVAEKCREAGFAMGQVSCACEFGLSYTERKPMTAIDAVTDNLCDAALCTDLLGSTGWESAGRGLCYLRPTYGTVSRYGLIPAMSSMDAIGVLAKTPEDAFSLLSVISGLDERDGVMFPEKCYTYESQKLKLTIGRESDFDLPRKDILLEVLFILFCAELSGNINRYDGLRFGFRPDEYSDLEDLYVKSRTKAFSFDTKLTLIMGAKVLSQDNYQKRYHKAMQIRRLVREDMNDLFSKFDVFSLPVQSPGYTAALLCGLPCLFLSGPKSDRLLLAAAGNENKLYTAAEQLARDN